MANRQTSNWRDSLRSNHRKTWLVIGIFFGIYLSIGVLIDLSIYAPTFPQVALSKLLLAMLSFTLIPLATLIMLAIAALSLLITYTFNNKLMLLGTDYYEITPATARTPQEQQLYNVVQEMQIAAGLRFMPRVYVIQAEYMNAFASGYSERSAMIAITQGLMSKLTRDELQAVMAHELSHIKHLDIKLTLTASLLANLAIMVLDVFFYQAIFSDRRNSQDRSRNILMVVIMIMRYVLPLINVLLLLYLSRTREFMADAGAVQLMRDNQPLASALIKIHEDHLSNKNTYSHAYQNTSHESVRREAYLYDPSEAGIHPAHAISDLFSTHPSIAARLAAIGITQNR